MPPRVWCACSSWQQKWSCMALHFVWLHWLHFSLCFQQEGCCPFAILEAPQCQAQSFPLPWSTVISSATDGINWPLFLLSVMVLVSSIFLAFVCDLLGPWAMQENLFPTYLTQLQYRKAPAALWPGLKSAGWFPRNVRGRDQHHCRVTLPFASLAWMLWRGAGHETPPNQKRSSRKAWLETQESLPYSHFTWKMKNLCCMLSLS